MTNEPDKAAMELITIAGGVEMEVTYVANGTSPGKKETVKVRQIPFGKFNEFLTTMGDEARSVELYCDKPKGWSDTLTLESANAIANTGQKINGPFFGEWFQRQARWRQMQQAWIGAGTADKRSPTRSVSASSPPASPITTT